MNISKDEAKILAAALEEAKYHFVDIIASDKEDANRKIEFFQALEKKLDDFSNDARRTGRTSQNSFSDVLRRYCK